MNNKNQKDMHGCSQNETLGKDSNFKNEISNINPTFVEKVKDLTANSANEIHSLLLQVKEKPDGNKVLLDTTNLNLKNEALELSPEQQKVIDKIAQLREVSWNSAEIKDKPKNN